MVFSRAGVTSDADGANESLAPILVPAGGRSVLMSPLRTGRLRPSRAF